MQQNLHPHFRHNSSQQHNRRTIFLCAVIIAHKLVFVNIITRKKTVRDVPTVQKGHPIKGCPRCELQKEWPNS